VRLVIGVIAGAAIFFEFPDPPTTTGIALICLSCLLALDGPKRSATIATIQDDVAEPLRSKSGN
jgi:hypothetical protein